MSTPARFARYTAVSALGAAVQLGVVAVLVYRFGAGPAQATAAGVSAALIHNFAWHRRWTWSDRSGGSQWIRPFILFVGANGVVSLAGSIVLVPLLAYAAAVPVVAANVVSIVTCGVINFWLGDVVVFARASHANSESSVR